MKTMAFKSKVIQSVIAGMFLLSLAHCSTVVAPSISYAIDEMQYFEGQPGATYTATISATPASCAITPDLPAGLTLNTTTCAISGTPSVASAQKSYTVVAQFAGTAPHSGASAATQIKLGAMSMTATRVYGQADFTSNVTAVSSTGLSGPEAVAVDSTGVYVTDYAANRALFYPHGSTTATRVYGQNGNFTTSTSGTSATTFNSPSGIALYDGNVYIADTGNHRVLKFSGTSTTAIAVYGQATMTANTSACTHTGLNNPVGITVNAQGVYIADRSNHRVLFYSGASTTPSRVYGQSNYTSCLLNQTGSAVPGANTLRQPVLIAVSQEGLYVADNANSRLLFYPGEATTPTRVYGQTSMTTTNTGTSRTGLVYPYHLAATRAGVFVADSSNRRVLFFAGTETSASGVIGQDGSFTTSSSALTSRKFGSDVYGMAYYQGGLYVVDSARRVLYFP